MNKLAVIFLFTGINLLVFLPSINAQSKQWINDYHEANLYFDYGAFDKALKIYTGLENKVDLGFRKEDLLFKIGVCYYHSVLEKEKAIDYFNRYIETPDHFQESYFLLAKTYHHFHQFSKAIAAYEKFKAHLAEDTKTDASILKKLIEDVDYHIERCNYGIILMSENNDVIVENLGPYVNSYYSEYAPVISHDESKLVFTKRSPLSNKGKFSPDGNYYEDIYIADITGGRLLDKQELAKKSVSGYFSLLKKFKSTKPESIGNKVNTKSHEGAVQFKPDDKSLYIYHDFNVWLSEFKDGEWQSPKKNKDIHSVVNTKAFEPSVSISIDEKLMFISSDRKGGFGGLDLYLSRKQPDGSWSEAENLGPEINTPYDEDGPYIDPDGRTLFFSSKGHSSMGGYDVFKTRFDGKNWGTPQNMGFPINSSGDDIFFMMTPLFNRAYYSSNKYGGYGQMDIYRLTFAQERTPLAEVKGLVKKGDTFIPAKSKITIIDAASNVKLYDVKSDSISGNYHIMLGHGKEYNMLVETEGFLPYQKKFKVPAQVFYFHHYQEIHHVHITDKSGNIIGEKVEMQNMVLDADINEIELPDSLSQLKSEINSINQHLATDINFYIPPDSVKKLMEDSSIVLSNIPENASIIFYNPKLNNDRVFNLETIEADDAIEMFVRHDADFLKVEKEFIDTVPSIDSLDIITSIPPKKITAILDESKEELVMTQITMAKAQYSLSGLFDVIENAELYQNQQKSAFEESIRLINESKMSLMSIKKILLQDSVHAISAIEAIRIAELYIEKMDKAIAQINNEGFSGNEKEEDLLNIKQLIAETQASLSQTEIALSMTPEEEQNLDESYDLMLGNLNNVEGLLGKLNNELDSNVRDSINLESFRYEIIKTELSLLKTTKLLKDNDSLIVQNDLINELSDLNKLLAKLEMDLIQLEDIKDGNQTSDNTMITILEETHQVISSASKQIESSEKELKTLPKPTAVPETLPVEIKQEKNESKQEMMPVPDKVILYFDYDRSVPKDKYLTKILEIKSFLEKNPDYQCKISGHTDSKGSEDYNLLLSGKRSEIVRNYMVNNGITTNRLIVEALGESRPLAPNLNPDGSDNPSGRQMNRRVEIELYQ